MTDLLELRRNARYLRKNSTEAEVRLWSLLRRRQLGGLKFRRQAVIGPFIADFACFTPRLIVELDGSQHAGSDYDARRDAWLAAQGYRVLRFWNEQVIRNRDGVARAILSAAGTDELGDPTSSRARTGPLRTPVRGFPSSPPRGEESGA